MNLKNIVVPILLATALSSCGGGGSEGQSQPTPGPTPNPPPTVPVPTPAPAPTIVAFDYVQKANNKTYDATQIQSASFTNATGGFRLPLADQSLTGNLTISVDLEDPDGINNVHVGFEGGTNALELCASQCGVTYHRTVTGINPLDHGRSSGPQQLQLWEEDADQNKIFLTTVNFTWNKTAVTGLNATRTAGNIDVSWNALNNYLRYNVYVASQAGVSHENYQLLADGEAFLAIRDPRKVLNGKEDAKAFFTAVTAIDGSGESAFSESIKILALSGAEDFVPTAVNDNYFMDEDTTLIENVLANDSDLESQTLTISTAPIRPPQNGTLIINTDGTINYTPTTDFVGRDNFSYRISDGLGQPAEAVVIITVNQANDPPESSFNNFNLIDPGQGRSINDPFSLSTSLTTVQALLSVAAPGLLINDLDIDGNTISVVTTPAVDPLQGTVKLNADGSLEYTNDPGSTGEDTFSYRTTDGTTVSDPPTVVRITINGASFFPVAANDHYSLAEGQTFVADNSAVGRMSILNNDSDLDAGDVLSINTTFVRAVAHGTLNMGTDGTFTYIPTPGYFGTDSFIYQITDLQGNTAQAGGIFTITRGNDAPIATTDTYTVTEDITFTADAASGVLSNDSDVDFDPIKIDATPLQAPINGQLTLSVDGSFVYIPDANFAGSDSFSYQVSDDRGGVANGTVTLTISNVNDIPVALDDTVQTIINSPITIAVLSNDSDIENQTLTVTSATTTTGTVTVNTDNTLTYTPKTNFVG
ncbi:MAG: tandem-95 repeat protein, partial [Algicola sp.]|nr:tandem-95 repeat protein [Algicola sp.]